MKVLFLDFDGVICLSSEWGGRYKKKGFDSNPETPMDIRMDSFNQKAVNVLNEITQKIMVKYNKSSNRSLIKEKNVYFIGDRVIQLENNYKKEVFNGDIGKITNLGKFIHSHEGEFGGFDFAWLIVALIFFVFECPFILGKSIYLNLLKRY
jgi:hypothetical protein